MDINFSTLPRALLAGLTIGIVSALVALSFASLIYSGSLLPYMIVGASASLLGSLVIALMLAIRSSSKLAIGCVQKDFAVIIAGVAAGISFEISKMNSADALPTIIAATMIMVSSAGFVIYSLGYLKLGKLINYFPHSVVGGFLAGAGWLMIAGVFNVLTSLPLHVINLSALFNEERIFLWGLPLLYACLMMCILRLYKHYLVYPSLLITAVILFYCYLIIGGTPYSEAVAHHWMMGPFPEGKLSAIPSLKLLSGQVQWRVIADFIPNYLTVIIIAPMGMLLNIASFEILSKQSMDMNREMRATGIGNIIAALVGGFGGYQSLSNSRINLKFECNTRWVGIFAALTIGIIVFIGPSILNFIPKFIFGVILFLSGLEVMLEWMVLIKKKISWSDYSIIVAIVVIIAMKGLLAGVLVGLGLSLILFFIRYSRLEVMQSILNGRLLHSNVNRPEHHRLVLEKKGGQIIIPIISGYLFFGNSTDLVQRIMTVIKESREKRTKYLIMDFTRVSGLELTCYINLIKLLQFCKVREINVLFANLPTHVKKEITSFVDAEAESLPYMECSDIDRAMEWCENELIQEEKIGLTTNGEDFVLDYISKEDTKKLFTYFEKVEAKVHDVIFKQDEKGTALFWLAKGSLDVILNYQTNNEIRLSRVQPGSLVGEMGLFLTEPRSATVIAVEPCILYRLTDYQLIKLTEEQPELGVVFYKGVINLLSRRLQDANKFISFVRFQMTEHKGLDNTSKF